MCPSAPRVCSEPGGQKLVLSLSLDCIIIQICKFSLIQKHKEHPIMSLFTQNRQCYGGRKWGSVIYSLPFPLSHSPHFSAIIWCHGISKLPATQLFVQQLVQADITENIKVPHHWWFPSQRASNVETVSMSQHHVIICHNQILALAHFCLLYCYTIRYITTFMQH